MNGYMVLLYVLVSQFKYISTNCVNWQIVPAHIYGIKLGMIKKPFIEPSFCLPTSIK